MATLGVALPLKVPVGPALRLGGQTSFVSSVTAPKAKVFRGKPVTLALMVSTCSAPGSMVKVLGVTVTLMPAGPEKLAV